MHLEILTPEEQLFQGEVRSVQLPGKEGRFEILNHHAPIVSSLVEGSVYIRTNEETTQIRIKDGFVECQQNKVVVLVGSGEIVS